MYMHNVSGIFFAVKGEFEILSKRLETWKFKKKIIKLYSTKLKYFQSFVLLISSPKIKYKRKNKKNYILKYRK